MPTEQQPAFVTKREVEQLKREYDFNDANCIVPEYVALNTLQHAMTLLGEECECHYLAPCGIGEELTVCQPCQRKAALLRVWNGENPISDGKV